MISPPKCVQTILAGKKFCSCRRKCRKNSSDPNRSMPSTKSRTAVGFLVCVVLLSFASALVAQVAQQTNFPEPPTDLTRVYYLDGDTLVALPFEPGASPFDIFQPAVDTRITSVRVAGAQTKTILTDEGPRLFAL